MCRRIPGRDIRRVPRLLFGPLLLGLALVLVAGCTSESGPPRRFGASAPQVDPNLPNTAKEGKDRYYQVMQDANGRWAFRSPDAKPFFSLGVNGVRTTEESERGSGRCPYCDAVAGKYATPDAWAQTAGDRLQSWGFNTLGAWSQPELFAGRFAYTQVIDFSGPWQPGAVPDWFDPDFERRAGEIASNVVPPLAQDRQLLGWFLDDDIRWGPDSRAATTLLDDYLALPVGSPGRTAAEQLRGNPAGFLELAAARYFEVAVRAVRAFDANHLILGVRASAVGTPAEVVKAAGRWVDVFSVDAYRYTPEVSEALAPTWTGPAYPPEPDLRTFHELSGRPILVTELSSRAADAGLPNTVPSGLPVEATQEQRGVRYGEYVGPLFGAPWVVGVHWYRYADSPTGGRAQPDDGQDSNFGLVSSSDEPWDPVVQRMTEVNARAPYRG
ncbi:hypothetical protein [Yinghuangia soli]|uniref:Agarase n=1 Tax=Yinghuangia soli TaxID=2908204 RepID=A0AA41TY23_9ACTN|nr:hypothetical protein [Yinghuangia soli]MCF2525931.1 hypothetical protein [Yinghuangia soli]